MEFDPLTLLLTLLKHIFVALFEEKYLADKLRIGLYEIRDIINLSHYKPNLLAIDYPCEAL